MTNDYFIEAATKEEWAVRALEAERKLAIAVEALRASERMIEGIQDAAYRSIDLYDKEIVYEENPASIALAKIKGAGG